GWEILDTGKQSAEENMRFDAELLEKAERFTKPVLHLYEWEGDCATYGYFIDPAKLLNLDKAKEKSLSLARRPTGGGIIFHIWDMAFSVMVPAQCPEFSTSTLDNYAFVNNAVLAAIKDFLKDQPPLFLTSIDFSPWDSDCAHFCMAKPTKYDVMWEGKKVAGAAQKKTKKGFLHQGTIALIMPPPDYLSLILRQGTQVGEAMQAHTCPILGQTASFDQVSLAKKNLRLALATHLAQASLSYSSQQVGD